MHLSREKRIAVLSALIEGNSERAVERMTDVNRKTVNRLALEFGTGAQRLHDSMAHNLSCDSIVADECWAYVFVKEARLRPDHPAGSGEAYVFCGIDKGSRYAVSWHIGKRNQASTDAFIADLRARLAVMPTIVTDGFVPYISAVGAEFTPAVSMCQTVKNYRSSGRRDDDHRYEPPRGIGFISKKTVYGTPDLATASTAHIERLNASMRHRIGRMRRLVYAFSKRLPNLVAACALNYCWTNLGCVLRTTRTTPAMALGVTTRLWTLEEFHDAITDMARTEVAKPVKQPLIHRAPPSDVVSRPLPSGRGFLRLLPGGGPQGPGLAPAPGPRPPAAPAAMPAPLREAPSTWEQLDLFGPRPGEHEDDPGQ